MKRLKKEEILIILSLSFPIIIENILQTLLGTTDTYFAGKLADNAIAGISITNIIMNIFISFFTAISIGTTAVVSRNYGKQDYKKTNQIIGQSILVSIIIGLLVGLICLFFYRPILYVSGADDSVLKFAIPYYLIVAVPSVFLCLQLVLSSCLRAIKDTKTPMYATCFSNILNILLDMLFINLGMGVIGLALATTVSRIVGMFILLFKLQHHDNRIYLSKNSFIINKEIISSLLFIGLPAGIEKIIMRVGQLIYNNIIISIGVSAYVAHNIAGTIESYAYIPAMGFGLATSTLIGISIGENNFKQATCSTWIGYFLACICMVIIGLIFYIFAMPLASIFTSTKEVQFLVADVLRLIAFFQPFSALVQVITSALQGAGDTKFPMYSTFLGIWGIRLGLGYFFAITLNYGLKGVWYAYALDLTIRGILLLIRFNRGRWKTITI
ncbi:MATE family efflux transporter [Thomasclavelia spiroformis]|uniref:MATE family efflux transporter n=1 Tax=Thomasclavelia spiroformis TaxID=29348 RepID=UPI00241F0FAB|nr:MATE family efflux transporter [Thomasclavelia spiroformis]